MVYLLYPSKHTGLPDSLGWERNRIHGLAFFGRPFGNPAATGQCQICIRRQSREILGLGGNDSCLNRIQFDW